MTHLPDAHPFLPAATGRRCAACRLVKRHGVHRGVAAADIRPMRARTGARWRPSGTPYMAVSGRGWTAPPVRS